MRRSRSSQRAKVQQARAIVNEALGETARRDGPQVVKYVPTTKTPEAQPQNDAIAVLMLKEAAVRLGLSTGELEAMVNRGTMRSLMAGWTVVIPSSDVERMLRQDTLANH